MACSSTGSPRSRAKTKDRRRRQAQGQAKAKADGRYRGRVEDVARDAGIASMLRSGQSYSAPSRQPPDPAGQPSQRLPSDKRGPPDGRDAGQPIGNNTTVENFWRD